MDAAILLPGRRTVAVVRQGLTSDRTAFSKRLWRLWEGPVPGAVLLLAPDEVRLRHARRLLAGARAPAMVALESHIARAVDGDPVWRVPSIGAAINLRSALDRAGVGGLLPAEPMLSRVSIPWDVPGDFPGTDLPEYLLPSPPQVRREAHSRSALRLAPHLAQRPGQSAGRIGVEGVPTGERPRGVRARYAGRRSRPPPGPHRQGAGAAGPQGPRLLRHRQEALEASHPWTRKRPSTGATSPAHGAGSFSGTRTTPTRCTSSWRPW